MQNENIKRNFLWNTAGSLIYFAAQWLFTLLVWRFGTQQTAAENAGLLNTSTTLTNTFLALASYGMYSYQVSDLKGKFSDNAYVNSRNITCAAAVLLCLIFVLFAGVFSTPYAYVQIICIFLMLGFKMLESKTDVYNAIKQKRGRLDLVGKSYALRGIFSLLAFVLGLAFTNSMTIAMVLMLSFNIAIYFIFTKGIVKNFYKKEKVKFDEVKLILITCAPLALYSFLNTTTSSIPKILLERIFGSEMLGIYGSVTAPVLLLQVGATYLFTPFITFFAQHYNSKNKKAFYKILLQVCAAILALLPLGLFVAEFLGAWGLRTFIDANLEQYQYLLSPMVVLAVITAIVLFFSMILTIMRAIKQLIIANVAGIITALIVSVPMLNMFEMQGATIAAIIALSVQVIVLCICLLKLTKRHFN